MRRTSKNIVLDSNVFFRTIGTELQNLKDKIIEVCDKIIVTTEILREYKTKCFEMGLPVTFVLRKLEELKKLGTLIKVGKSIITKVNVVPNKPISNKITHQRDPQDDKFILAARASRALCIITFDHYLLSLDNHYEFRIVEPDNYLSNLL